MSSIDQGASALDASISAWDNKPKNPARQGIGFGSNTNQYRSVFDSADNDVASIVSSLSGVSNHTFGAGNSNLFSGNKSFNDNSSDIDGDVFGKYKKGALSAISQPLALGKNNSRLQSNVFGAASISGGLPTTVGSSGSSNFLDKFSSVAEATKEVEHLANFGRLSLSGKRSGISSRRASFMNEEARTSPLLEKIGSPNSIHESLNGGAYRSSLSERIDNFYKSPNESNTRLSASEYSSSEKSSVSIQVDSGNASAALLKPSNLEDGLINSDNSNNAGFHTIWNPAAATSFTPMFNSQASQQPPMFAPQPYPYGYPLNQYPMSMMPPPPPPPGSMIPGSQPQGQQPGQPMPPFIAPPTDASVKDAKNPAQGSNGEIKAVTNGAVPGADDKMYPTQPMGMMNNGVPMVFGGFNPYPMFPQQGNFDPQQVANHQPGPLQSSTPSQAPPVTPSPASPSKDSHANNKANDKNGNSSQANGYSKGHRKGSRSPPTNSRRKNHIYRSPLLEQFRNDKSNKKYTLSDIFEHAVEFSKDQHGSRFIQQEIEHASAEEKEVFFNQIRDVSVDLMVDVFGNYVIQKFFEFGTDIQRGVLFDNMKGKIYDLSLQMYGCRVVQRAIGKISLEQRLLVVEELKDDILTCVKDQNANHVIQKSIESIPFDQISFILESLKDHIYHLSTNPYGCRVIQRLLEFGRKEDQEVILGELSRYVFYLIQDQYGNYVIQHILENGSKQEREKISKIVRENVVNFSKHKFASNVVEKTVFYGDKDEREAILNAVLKGNEKDDNTPVGDDTPLALMMKDQFANYVVQKLVDIANGNYKRILIKKIKIYLDQISSANFYGKHLASIEKLSALSETASKELDI